ncbi:MAG TPA: glutamine amidotransferase [Paucimonas sp.]|nr:glutamine amidotransferase [Paucimonas sp.]
MASPKPLVIFKVGNAVGNLAAELGDFEDWIVDAIGPTAVAIEIVDPRRGDALPRIAELGGAIVTGSGAMVTDRAPWSEELARWLRGAVAAQVPVLGICYGHQLLAHALGGEVGYHPGGIEIGTVTVERLPAAREDTLFGHLPDRFPAQAVHRQSVLRLPPGAVPLAGNGFEPHHAFRAGASAWGVQFHPEFGAEAMRRYIGHCTGHLAGGEAAAAALTERVVPTEEASSVLRTFASFVERERDSPVI